MTLKMHPQKCLAFRTLAFLGWSFQVTLTSRPTVFSDASTAAPFVGTDI
jgi:hypothetical protein